MNAPGPKSGAPPPACRLLARADIPAAQRLRALAGWNQTDRDWEHLLAFEPEGCFAALMDGHVAGTATTTRYRPGRGPGSFGWVGMVLVDPERRRLGIGSALLKKSIHYLQARGVESVRLDATPQGRKVYERLGFVDEYPLERWTGTARALEHGPSGPWTLAPIQPEDLDALAAYDRPIFGAERRKVLEAWWRDWPELSILARREGRVAGYGLARRGDNFQQIGPLIGDDPELREALLAALLGRLAGRPVLLDLVSANEWAAPIAERCGLKLQRPFIRMALGPNTSPGEHGNVLAICCPELG